MKFLRSLAFVTLLYGSLILLGIVYLPALLMPRHVTIGGMRIWARIARWGMKHLIGAETELRGLESLPPEPLILTPRHQSMIDTLLPFLFLKDPCFVLKKELMYYPIFGWYAAKTGMIAIDRSGSMKTLKLMTEKAKSAVSDGRSLVIFPEGTRVSPDEPAELKPGIALLYKDLNVPCVPVALNTGYCWPAHGLMRYPGQMVMHILRPINAGLPRKAFMQQLETTLAEGMKPLLAADQIEETEMRGAEV